MEVGGDVVTGRTSGGKASVRLLENANSTKENEDDR